VSDHIQSRPLSPKGRENYDAIFQKKSPAPLKPASDCCFALLKDTPNSPCFFCSECGRPCNLIYP